MTTEVVRTPATSVVICCYSLQRWGDLCAAVAEVRRQASDETEIVVCVDHNAQLHDRATTELEPVARVVPNDREPGLSGARNAGLEAARGDVVVFLDDDAVPEPGWLAALAAPFRDPSIKAVGGAAAPAWPERRPPWFPDEFDWVVGCSYRGLPETRGPVRNVMGCNMAVHASVFRAGLRFHSGVGRSATNVDGGEETELCIRVRQLWPDAQVVFEPAARVRHRVPGRRATWRYFARRCYAEGRSKARVSSYVGSQDALATEWAYTRRVLPIGVLRGIREAASGDAEGLVRSAAILAGLGITSVGYVRGRYAG